MVQLKQKNIKTIRTYCKFNVLPTGEKMEAIYRLIQKRGVPIESEDKLNGIMCLMFDKGEYIALKRTGSKEKFFPCSIKKIYLTANNIQ